MNEHATLNMASNFDALLTSSVASASGRAFWRTPRTLRLTVAATDFAQTICVGVATHFVAANSASVSWKALCLGFLVSSMALAMRRAMRGAGVLDEKAAASESARAALATLAAICAAGAICWLLSSRDADVIVEWFMAWVAISSTLSAALRIGRARLRRTICGAVRVVVVGQPMHAAAALHRAESAVDSCWCVAGRVDAGEPNWLDQLHSIVAQADVDVVALTLTGPNAGERIALVCSRLADQPVRVCLAIDSAALGWTPRALERFGDAALVDLITDPHGGLDGAAKRALDIVLSTLALVALGPLLAVVAVAVRLESPGPIFFRQKRFGLGGRHIEVLKFRSMRMESCDVTGANRTLARDPRVTRIGRILRRLSIDELPQLINVLRSDMSLVGPRPHPLHMRVGEHYYFVAVEEYRTRHVVKPGITGWAQINGSRGEVDTIEKARRRVELDLWYLENWSFWLDFRIIVRTILGGFSTKGAD